MSRNSGDNNYVLDESVNSEDFLRSRKLGSSGTPFLHFLSFLSQRSLRTSDKNFENILFANANFEVLDAELRKRKQPERDDDNE